MSVRSRSKSSNSDWTGFQVLAISSSPRLRLGLELIARTWNPVQSELEDLERLLILINYSGGKNADENNSTGIYWFNNLRRLLHAWAQIYIILNTLHTNNCSPIPKGAFETKAIQILCLLFIMSFIHNV